MKDNILPPHIERELELVGVLKRMPEAPNLHADFLPREYVFRMPELDENGEPSF